jgi:hypothetical protein
MLLFIITSLENKNIKISNLSLIIEIKNINLLSKFPDRQLILN